MFGRHGGSERGHPFSLEASRTLRPANPIRPSRARRKIETPKNRCGTSIRCMSIELMRKRLAADRASFIEPCLPSPADKPPSGANWIHEIKHDGYRLMARRDPVGIRLMTRRGNDWSNRFPLVVEAVNHLKVRSCLIDGEVVCCDERGVAAFQCSGIAGTSRRHSSTPSICWS